MGYARLFPEAEKGGRGKKLSGKSESLGVSKGHWQNLVSQARTVRRETPELAIKVRDGFALNEAYEVAMTQGWRVGPFFRLWSQVGLKPPKRASGHGPGRARVGPRPFRPSAPRGRFPACVGDGANQRALGFAFAGSVARGDSNGDHRAEVGLARPIVGGPPDIDAVSPPSKGEARGPTRPTAYVRRQDRTRRRHAGNDRKQGVARRLDHLAVHFAQRDRSVSASTASREARAASTRSASSSALTASLKASNRGRM
jgi:hypothetical protein